MTPVGPGNMLKWFRSPSSVPRHDAFPPAVPWRRRLQNFPVRTKIVVPLVGLAIIPAFLVGVFAITRTRSVMREATAQRLKFDATAKAAALQGFLRAVEHDLDFLARNAEIRELAQAEASGQRERVAVLRKEVEDELLVFCQGKRAYYQVRYLNGQGHEVVRLNAQRGEPRVVPLEKLQDKSRRYYVREALALEPGEIYVSPMDLNIEHGTTEEPFRGVVRYAAGVVGLDGTGRGLVVINVYADHILSLIGPPPHGAEAWLVGPQGTYLGYAGSSHERRSLYRLDKQRRVSEDYGPKAVAAILGDQGGAAIQTAEHFLAFCPFTLQSGRTDRRWVLLIAHPRAPLERPARQLTVFLGATLAMVLAVAGVSGILIGSYLARPIANLRKATRRIAQGDLDQRVQVTTCDEFEELATDFNLMTERLREARHRLAAWNEDLEREVARKTEALHRLQTGLARADKMASIGQMTAGVVHEVGNPLAAIKTKIQVAEEDGHLCQRCQALLSDVLGEVDRLAVFLRSFSRLGRLREPQMQRASLDEIVREVVALIGAELGRRGLRLTVESASEAPLIRGDPGQLRQLLINLVLNAAEASDRGGVISVRLQQVPPRPEATGHRGTVRVVIEDRGAGIPAELADKIWDPFYTTRPDGTGLGLAICRQIVTDHGGRIDLQSSPGEGTTFTIEFPAWSDAAPSDAAVSDAPAPNVLEQRE